jgi:hypothetical protein
MIQRGNNNLQNTTQNTNRVIRSWYTIQRCRLLIPCCIVYQLLITLLVFCVVFCRLLFPRCIVYQLLITMLVFCVVFCRLLFPLCIVYQLLITLLVFCVVFCRLLFPRCIVYQLLITLLVFCKLLRILTEKSEADTQYNGETIIYKTLHRILTE